MREIKLKAGQKVITNNGKRYIVRKGDKVVAGKNLTEKEELFIYYGFKKRDEAILPYEVIYKKIAKIKDKDMLNLALDYGLKVEPRNAGAKVSIIIDLRNAKVFAHNYDIYGKDAESLFEYTIANVNCYTDNEVEDFYSMSDDAENWENFSDSKIESDLVAYKFFHIEENYEDLYDIYEEAFYYAENGNKVYPY